MNDFHELRWRAAVVRAIPLESVLIIRGAVRDPRDRRKWHTEQGVLSVRGPKFMNWQQSRGGGGAIDLVMHLGRMDFPAAVQWLEQHVVVAGEVTGPCCGTPRAAAGAADTADADAPSRTLCLPLRDDRLLDRVRCYLTRCRHLAAALVDLLVDSGRLYADSRGNAVFVMSGGTPDRPVGAELRGTGPRIWHGLAPGSRKDAGYFSIGERSSRIIVLCESAIDAISCHQLHPQRICISTSGVRANPGWLSGLIGRGHEIHCGFDTDTPGDTTASRMLARHPTIKRFRPPAHDWNDALVSSR